jgi:hypothetical protein
MLGSNGEFAMEQMCLELVLLRIGLGRVHAPSPLECNVYHAEIVIYIGIGLSTFRFTSRRFGLAKSNLENVSGAS